MSRISVHCPAELNFYRAAWLLSEMDIDFELEIHESIPQIQLPFELSTLEAIAGAAIIELDGDLFIETPSAMQLLVERFGRPKLAPPVSSPSYARFLRLLHFGEGLPGLRDFARPDASPAFHHWALGWVSSLDQALMAMLDHLDAMLAESPFMAGPEFSAADIQITTLLSGVQALGLLEDRDSLSAYLVGMQARPAYQTYMRRDAAARATHLRLTQVASQASAVNAIIPPSYLHQVSKGCPL